MRRFGWILDTVMLDTLRRRRWAAAVRDMAELCAELRSSRGEISGAIVAEEILDRFETGDDAVRWGFFAYLADRLDIDPDRVQPATQRLRREGLLFRQRQEEARMRTPERLRWQRVNELIRSRWRP